MKPALATQAAKAQHPAIHALLYGFSGSKKSTLAASFPTPGFVAMFDAYGMDGPYLRRGDSVKSTQSDFGIPIKRVFKKGELLFELHYYHDEDPSKPDAWPLFRKEHVDFEHTKWATWIVDGVAEAVDAAKFEQAKLNPGMAVFRQLGPVTDQLSLHFKTRPKAYECNVVLITQVAQRFVTIPSLSRDKPERRIDKGQEGAEEDDEGAAVLHRGYVAPGRLGRDAGLASQMSEVYRCYVTRENGKRVWAVQTEPDEIYIAKTQIGAPDGCPPDYESLWS